MLQNIGPKHETTTFGSQFKSSDSNEQLHARDYNLLCQMKRTILKVADRGILITLDR